MPTLQSVRYSLRGALAKWFEQPAATFLARIGFTPNRATLAGLALAFGATYLAAEGLFWQAGLVNAAGALFDMLDGAIARQKNVVSKRGALLDSSADRVAEGALLVGLAWHYSDVFTYDRTAVLLAFMAFGGSMMVSYVRARAEGLGFKGTSGFLTRPERVVIITAGLIIGQPKIALWILAIGTPISALHRFWAEWRTAGKSA